MGHTPGPWRSTHYNAVLKSCNFFAIEADGYCGQIAEVDDDTKDAEANARLIAAAPDLLEACKDCLERLQAYSERGLSFPLTTAKARTAIAKAEGRD